MTAPPAFEPPAFESRDAAAPAQRWLKAAPLLILALGVIVALALGAHRYLSLEVLRDQRTVLLGLVAAHPWASIALYVGAYALVVAFSIPCALAMTLAGGFLFGAITGAAAAAVGVSTGAVAMFLVARSALGDVIRRRFPEGGRMRRLEAKIRAHAFTYLLTLRLLPAVPLFLVNIAAGFVRMRLSTYVAATVIGVLPSCFIYASVGSGLGHVFEHGGGLGLALAADPQITGPMAGLALLSCLPFGVHFVRRRRALLRGPG